MRCLNTLMKASLFALLLAAAAVAPAQAGSFEDGLAAYERGEYAAALSLWRPLAKQGHAKAQLNLGFMYGKGRGVPKDYAEAAKWCRRAADQGDAQAQFNLGNMYAMGQGVPKDYAKAFKWFRRAAKQGLAQAQSSLGNMYRKGQGVPKDYVQAHKWFNLAASRTPPGNLRDLAVKGRDIVAERMTPAQIAKAQRLAREWMEKHGKGK